MNKSISFFAPAYNEQDNIEEFVATAHKYLKDNFKDFEIIIVNDGSTDLTFEKLENLSYKYKELKIINHKKNMGYGCAIRSGIKNSTKELIFFTDSDLQFSLNEINSFIREINESPIVIGYRNSRKDNFLRNIYARIWAILVKTILGIKIKDINCAFKLFKREAIKNIILDSSGASINAEILFKAVNAGYKIKELPVSHFSRKRGKQTGANPRVVIKALKELFTIKEKLKESKT